MTAIQRHQIARFTAASDWILEHSAFFGARTLAKARAIKTLLGSLNSGGQTQHSSEALASAAAHSKEELIEAVRFDLQIIADIARIIARETPDFHNSFVMPDSHAQGAVVSAGEAFFTASAPVETLFLDYELPANFRADLRADLDAIAAKASDQTRHDSEHSGDTATLATQVSRGTHLIEELDALVPTALRKIADKNARENALKQWETVSKRGEVPRHPKRPAPAPSPQT